MSLALSACAACHFLEARPVITLNQKLAPARALLAQERPEAAVEALTRLATSQRLQRDAEAQVHLLLAEAIDTAEKQRRQSVPGATAQIIEQTQLALAKGIKPTAVILRRMGDAYEALGRPTEAAAHYRQAIAMDPPRTLRLQRKVIDLQFASADSASAEASLDAYLASDALSDAERAWAKNEKAQLLIDRGQCVDARRVLEDALKLNPDPIAQGETRYRLGLCAWKLKEAPAAEKLLRAARSAFKGQHPLDAKAALTLGIILVERNAPAEAIAMLDVAAASSDAATAMTARIERGMCRISTGDVNAACADLTSAAAQAKVAGQMEKDAALAGLRKGAQVLATRQHHQAAVELLLAEQALDGDVPAGFHARLAGAYEKRAQQVEQSIADASGAEKVRRTQLAREFWNKAADAQLAYSRALAATGEQGAAEALFDAVETFERIGEGQRAAEALELFVSENADDALAPQALLRLGRTYEAMAQVEKAISAYQRLAVYTDSPAAIEGAMPLARLHIAKGPAFFAAAQKVLAAVLASGSDAPAAKDAALELARLEHRMGNFDAARNRLEQLAAKYPNDEHAGEVIYLTADCYAKLASLIDDRAASASASAEGNGGPEAMERASEVKRQHLARASALFARANEIFRAAPPTDQTQTRYREASALRHADCAYELGEFADAIALYESAATEPANALAAYVQIVNANVALGRMDDARAANERARALMNRMPADAFADGTFPMPRSYWEQWLNWANDGGMR